MIFTAGVLLNEYHDAPAYRTAYPNTRHTLRRTIYVPACHSAYSPCRSRDYYPYQPWTACRPNHELLDAWQLTPNCGVDAIERLNEVRQPSPVF